jgi:hypothetical protein
MKNDLLLLALASAAAWFIMKSGGVAAALRQVGAKEIGTDVLPGQPGYGWRYFDDGTVIDPWGRYYSNGVQVWAPGGL